ncbi:MAG: Hpt domain-containing protein [Treponema sp.]|jgi:two-component system chemotaxis sensor kinase CheA|nr:Hpt domain-containing protein [Treponema sp.]
MVSLKDRFFLFITSGKFTGSPDEAVKDEMIRIIILNITYIAGSILIFGMGIGFMQAGAVDQGLLYVILGSLIFTNLLLLRTELPFIVGGLIVIILFGGFCGILVFREGDLQGFAGLWIYSFPLMSIFTLGMPLGLFPALLLLGATVVGTFVPGLAEFHYTLPQAIRICAVYVFVLGLTIAYEQVRRVKDRWGSQLTRNLKIERDQITVMQDNLELGLFLMNRDCHIQGQYSKALEQILAARNLEGIDFFSLLASSQREREQGLLKDYFDMIFDRLFDQAILKEINPIRELSYTSGETGEQKILKCEFTSVDRGSDGVFILGNIQDITAEKELQQKLAEEKSLRQEEMHSLFELIQVDLQAFDDFIEDAEHEFRQIEAELTEGKHSTQEILVNVYQSIHAIKSNAVILGLQTFGDKVHALESKVRDLRDDEAEVSPEGMEALREGIEHLKGEKNKFWLTLAKINAFKASGDGRKKKEDVFIESLARTSEKASAALGKLVEFKVDALDAKVIELGPRRIMKEVLMQLIRNSVYHGIEIPEERIAQRKDPTGKVRLSITQRNNLIQIVLQDDGRGLDFEHIRQKAEAMGTIRTEAEGQDQKLLLKILFSPGFSTAESENLYAGRGVGLSLVRDRLRDVKGSIKVQSEMGRGTAFIMSIPLR